MKWTVCSVSVHQEIMRRWSPCDWWTFSLTQTDSWLPDLHFQKALWGVYGASWRPEFIIASLMIDNQSADEIWIWQALHHVFLLLFHLFLSSLWFNSFEKSPAAYWMHPPLYCLWKWSYYLHIYPPNTSVWTQWLPWHTHCFLQCCSILLALLSSLCKFRLWIPALFFCLSSSSSPHNVFKNIRVNVHLNLSCENCHQTLWKWLFGSCFGSGL